MSAVQIVKKVSAKKLGKKQRRRHSIMAFEMVRLIALRMNRFMNNFIARFAMNWFRQPSTITLPDCPHRESWRRTWEYRVSR